MANVSGKRTDTASRVIAASPHTIYRAFLDPQAVTSWLPPAGMTAELHGYEPKVGSSYRMVLTYERSDHRTPGKTSDHSDVIRGRFLELVPDERIVQVIDFESQDPAFTEAMRMTWSLTALAGGTRITIVCDNVPEAIRQDDHDAGLRSTLENLAAFVE
jgi:uncharacterized protein YndB with AHSA1/START domain